MTNETNIENNKNKKYLSVVLDKNKDKELISSIELVNKLCNVSIKEMITKFVKSNDCKELVKKRMNELNKLTI